ncbi:TIM-barrel domain-containing protein [Planifilum fimeticola]
MKRRIWIPIVLCLALLLQPSLAQGGSATKNSSVSASETSGKILLNGSGYRVEITSSPFRITTKRNDEVVMSTVSSGDPGGPARFMIDGEWYHATEVEIWHWDGKILHLGLATTSPDHLLHVRLVPETDRYRIIASVTDKNQEERIKAEQLGFVYDLGSSGHWYGHGETSNRTQPWPLDSGQVRNSMFGPASYLMIDPFWFTSKAVGLWVDTQSLMDVSINDKNDGLGKFFIKDTDAFNAVVFVEKTPKEVFYDYIGIAGKPEKSDNVYEQYRLPLWNTWAQFYEKVDQAKVIEYAEGLAKNDLSGHTVQLDDKWESNYGNFTFDTEKFPDPKAMVDRIHELGFDFGLWTTLWINQDSENYKLAEEKGYLLKDAQDPNQTCEVTWWNGTAGIIDLANPEARQWYVNKLKTLMERYGVDGFKFDTRFFDERCAPRSGFDALDYLTLGAELADQFDLQGAGIRISWSGSQKYGFVTRQVDKDTNWGSLQAAVTQNLAISTIGYPFVTTDMIGGSLHGPPPKKETLVRWAQASSLMPIMYSSTSPLGMTHADTGETNDYDNETVVLYRAAIEEHKRLTPYIWKQVQRAVKTGEPIMKPLFFNFPDQEETYTITDQWLLGDTVMAAPVLTEASTRDIYIPPGHWYDVRNGKIVKGPTTIKDYAAPLHKNPVFVKLGSPETGMVMKAFRSKNKRPLAWFEVEGHEEYVPGNTVEVKVTFVNHGDTAVENVELSLTPPEGWTIKKKSKTKFDKIRGGQRGTTAFEVTPPSDATPGVHQMTAVASYKHRNKRYTEEELLSCKILDPRQIPQSRMTATATSEEEGRDPAEHAIDGNKMTMWHTDWSKKDPLPQSITLHLGGEYRIDEVRYLPRQDTGTNGIITKYQLLASTDGIHYHEVAGGSWAQDKTEKRIRFSPVDAAYIQMVAVEGVNGYASAAEINVYQAKR